MYISILQRISKQGLGLSGVLEAATGVSVMDQFAHEILALFAIKHLEAKFQSDGGQNLVEVSALICVGFGDVSWKRRQEIMYICWYNLCECIHAYCMKLRKKIVLKTQIQRCHFCQKSCLKCQYNMFVCFISIKSVDQCICRAQNKVTATEIKDMKYHQRVTLKF